MDFTWVGEIGWNAALKLTSDPRTQPSCNFIFWPFHRSWKLSTESPRAGHLNLSSSLPETTLNVANQARKIASWTRFHRHRFYRNWIVPLVEFCPSHLQLPFPTNHHCQRRRIVTDWSPYKNWVFKAHSSVITVRWTSPPAPLNSSWPDVPNPSFFISVGWIPRYFGNFVY